MAGSEGDVMILESIAKLKPVIRGYYGDDKENKPNGFCYWDDVAYPIGWHETRSHFITRLKKVWGAL